MFYLHHLEGHSQFIDRSKVPISAWTEKKTRAVIRWINASGGYSVKKVTKLNDLYFKGVLPRFGFNSNLNLYKF